MYLGERKIVNNYKKRLSKNIFVLKIKKIIQRMLKGNLFLKRLKLNLINRFFYYEHTQRIFYIQDKLVAYLSTSKVACTSIRAGLLNCNDSLEKMAVYSEFRQKTYTEVENPQDYYLFTFVRNPFERLVSCYKSKVGERNLDAYVNDYLFGYITTSKDFKTFVKRIRWIPSFLHEPHIAPLYHIIYKRRQGRLQESKRIPNFIGRMENLEQDWNYLKNRFELGELPHLNTTKSDNWMDYYDEESAKLVYKFYKKDILAFGYEKEYENLLEYLKKRENKR